MIEQADRWIQAAFIACVAWLAPVHGLMAAVGVLIVADLVTGLMAAKHRGEAITSAKLKRTVIKAIAYQIGVLSGFALEILVPGSLPVAKLVASAIGMVELKSILENVTTLTGVSFKTLLQQVVDKNKDGK